MNVASNWVTPIQTSDTKLWILLTESSKRISDLKSFVHKSDTKIRAVLVVAVFKFYDCHQRQLGIDYCIISHFYAKF